MSVPDRPNFFETYADIVRMSARTSGWKALVPVSFLICCSIGAFAALSVPANFWVKSPTSEAMTIYGSFLAFNGLLLALGWGAMSRIYDVLLRGSVSKVLVSNNLLSHHLVSVEATHFFLIASAFASACALFLTIYSLPFWAYRIVLFSVVTLGLYSIKCVWSLMGLLSELGWEDAHLTTDNHGNIISIKKNGSPN
jgi:hypothetical protein